MKFAVGAISSPNRPPTSVGPKERPANALRGWHKPPGHSTSNPLPLTCKGGELSGWSWRWIGCYSVLGAQQSHHCSMISWIVFSKTCSLCRISLRSNLPKICNSSMRAPPESLPQGKRITRGCWCLLGKHRPILVGVLAATVADLYLNPRVASAKNGETNQTPLAPRRSEPGSETARPYQFISTNKPPLPPARFNP